MLWDLRTLTVCTHVLSCPQILSLKQYLYYILAFKFFQLQLILFVLFHGVYGTDRTTVVLDISGGLYCIGEQAIMGYYM